MNPSFEMIVPDPIYPQSGRATITVDCKAFKEVDGLSSIVMGTDFATVVLVLVVVLNVSDLDSSTVVEGNILVFSEVSSF